MSRYQRTGGLSEHRMLLTLVDVHFSPCGLDPDRLFKFASCLKMPAEAAAMGTARGREMTGKICFHQLKQSVYGKVLDFKAAVRPFFAFRFSKSS